MNLVTQNFVLFEVVHKCTPMGFMFFMTDSEVSSSPKSVKNEFIEITDHCTCVK